MNLRHFYVEWKLWKIIETERRYELETISPNTLSLLTSVMRVGSDTFGDPIFQKGLQN